MTATQMFATEATGPDPVMPSRRVRILVLVASLAASGFLFAATFNSSFSENVDCRKCGSEMTVVADNVLLPMPRGLVVGRTDGADGCDHSWQAPVSNPWCPSRGRPASHELLGLLLWLALAVGVAASLVRPLSRTARFVSLAVAAVAMVLIVGGDIWLLTEGKSKIDEMGGLGSLNAADLYSLRVGYVAMAWHIAATVVCFGGAAAWFTWLLRLREPVDGDHD